MPSLFADDTVWRELVGRFPFDLDLEATAREHGALIRARKVKDAETLLRLALIYGTTALSLRSTAAWAEASGLASLSDVGLMMRLQGSDAWLEAIVGRLLGAPLLSRWRAPALAATGLAGRRIRIVDATMLSLPGRNLPCLRLHAAFEFPACRFSGFQLTSHRDSESLERFMPEPGEVTLGDRFYAKARSLHHTVAHGADFVVRRGVTGCTLYDADGQRLTLSDILKTVCSHETTDIPVLIPRLDDAATTPLPARLVVRHLGSEGAAKARRKAIAKARRAGRTIGRNTLEAAEYCMLLTSLSEDDDAAEAVLDLYRLRWQVEIAFKRLKSIAGLADFQAKEPRLVRSTLFAKLILALLSQAIIGGLDEAFFPES